MCESKFLYSQPSVTRMSRSSQSASSNFELAQLSLTQQNSATAIANTLQYTLPYPINLTGYDVALASLFLNYSWPNISAKYGDNYLGYAFPTSSAGATTVVNVNFPDGNYAISDISNYVQFVMGQNGHYLLDNTGTPVYYLSLLANSTYYAVTLESTPVPTSLPTGWSNPNGINLSGLGPQLIVPSTTGANIASRYFMNQLIAFNGGTYPSFGASAGPTGTYYQLNSNYTGAGGSVPEISPVSSVSLNCSLTAASAFNVNPQTIYSFAPNVPYGSQIAINPTQLIWLKAQDSQFNSITLQFADQNGLPLGMLDGSIVANLYVRRREKASRSRQYRDDND